MDFPRIINKVMRGNCWMKETHGLLSLDKRLEKYRRVIYPFLVQYMIIECHEIQTLLDRFGFWWNGFVSL
jgi:hypothetical protein